MKTNTAFVPFFRVVAGLALCLQLWSPSLFAATVSWVGGSGDWNTPANWSTDALPGPDDDVVLGAGPSISVTHSSGTHIVRSIQGQQLFVLSGGSLTVSNAFVSSNTFTLSGGTLVGAQVTMAVGAVLMVAGNIGGTLDGVTVNGTLDVGNTYSGANLVVTNGLVLDGTLRVGNPTNGNFGAVSFVGSQTLGGNGVVVLGNDNFANYDTAGRNALRLSVGGTTLTIGLGITIEGQNGMIGYSPSWGGPGNVSVINLGTVSQTSSGTMSFEGSWVVNQGLFSVVSNGALNVYANLTNTGTFAATNSSVSLGGTFTLADLGAFDASGATVNLTGVLENSNTTLSVNALGGRWVLDGGAIQSGTVVATNGASLIVYGNIGGTLDGVTVNGTLDVGNTYSGANLVVTNGLVLDGTLRVGNPTNGNFGAVSFVGSQTLGGNGVVVLGNDNFANYDTAGRNALRLSVGGTTLTIGLGITIEGQNGMIGYSPSWGGPGNVSVINLGTVSQTSSGTMSFEGSWVVNQGLFSVVSNGALNVYANLTNTGTFAATNSSVSLGGTFTLADLGAFDASGATVNLTGVLENSNTTLSVNALGGRWVLDGGAIQSGTVVATNGASLIVYGNIGGTLDGVTVNGTLDVGNTYSGANLVVTNGLVLDGTLRVGNPTNGNFGAVSFVGSQTLGGNGVVVLGNDNFANYDTAGRNALRLSVGGTTLTIGLGITIEGQNGMIGYSPSWGGPGNVSVINLGTVSQTSSGTMSFEGSWVVNQGLFSVVSNGALNVYANLTNTGTFAATNSSVSLGGTFTLADLGAFDASGATVNLTGVLENSNTTLSVNALGGRWVLDGGAIQSGTVVATNGASLIVYGNIGGTLDGVTVNGTLDVGNTYSGANLVVTNGLVLDGTLRVGNPTNGNFGAVSFVGSQTLGGNGVVVLGNDNFANYDTAGRNALRLSVGGTTLTIGLGITIEGQNGMIGYSPSWGGPGNVSVINLGTVSADVRGGIISIEAQAMTNAGNLNATTGATLSWDGDLNFNGPQILTSQPGGTIAVGGSIFGNPASAAEFNPQGTVSFGSGSHELEAMSTDMGNIASGYVNNFAYGGITLASGAQVTLANLSGNNPGGLPECVYVNSLSVASGASLNLNGIRLYARLAAVGGTITGGTVVQAPNSGGPIPPASTVSGALTNAGALADWTFFGRAGHQVAVVVDTGSASILPPQLDYAFVQLFDPLTNLLAETSNTVAGKLALLNGVTLPVDGTYSVKVRAPATHATSTGNYQITVWDVTPSIQSLVLNQQANGQISTPYSVDQWNFAAVANQQIRFDLLNVSAPGVEFNLTGPTNWIGFTNLTMSSDLITLPASGTYTVTASGIENQYDIAYAFELVQTVETNLPLGATFTGQFAANGQAELFAVTVTNSGPLDIVMNNSGASNVTELYVKLGSPPTRGVFDFESINPNSPSQQILIPSAVVGTYYILVYGNLVSTPGAYTVSATSSEVIVGSTFPGHLGVGANGTITLTGAGFLPSTTVSLVSSNGTVYSASSVSDNSFTQLTATFASNSVPTGVYSVLVKQADGTTSELTNAFQFTSGGQGNLVANLILPGFLGRHINATIYVQYANTGTAAIPAPLLVVSGNQGTQQPIMALAAGLTAEQRVAAFWTSAEPPGWSQTVQFLASGQTPGILEPGESNIVAIAYGGLQQPWDFSVNTVTMSLGVMTETNRSPIDWSSLESTVQPSNISTDAWPAIWQNFTNQIGGTWGSYIRTVNQDAQYFGNLGLTVTDFGKLTTFELLKANGLTVNQNLASSMDASTPAPGVPLAFQRIFPQSISARYHLGPLGRGWDHNWDISLNIASDGSINIVGPADLQRHFLPDTRGGYFSGPGDYSTLTYSNNGTFTLQEANGLLRAFGSEGNLTYVQDANGNRVTCGYSGGMLITLTHSAGPQLNIAYNSLGLIESITDSANQTTSFAYDAEGQHLISALYPGGRTVAYSYTTPQIAPTNAALADTLNTITYPDSTHQYFTYDNRGRLLESSRDEGAQAVSYSYSSAGAIFLTDGNGDTSTVNNDQRGVIIKSQDPVETSTFLSFDPYYDLLSFLDPTGRSTINTYDSAGNLTQLTDALGHSSQFSHSSEFNSLASFTDANGNMTHYTTDTNGNLLSSSYADGTIDNWTFDNEGNPLNHTNRRGQTVPTKWNSQGQMIERVYPDGRTIYYNHDARGLLTNIADGIEGVTSLQFDGRGFLTNITYPSSNGFAFFYNNAGHRVSRIGTDGYILNYSYDYAGRLQTLSNNVNGLLVRYVYDASGKVEEEEKGNGTFTTYTYDPAGRIIAMTNCAPDGTSQSFFNYAYDAKGNRIAMTTKKGLTHYAYDDLNQLISVTYPSGIATSLLYDPLGNRVSVDNSGTNAIYRLNVINEYTQSGETSFNYDLDGNLASQSNSVGTTFYGYDFDDRLISILSPTGDNWQFAYDSMGNRSTIVYNGVTNFLLNDPVGCVEVAAKYDSSRKLLNRYDYALGLVASMDASGNEGFYSFDGLGNTREISGTGGTIFNSYDYDSFGILASTVETVSNDYYFGGRLGVVQDPGGLLFMRTRTYSPCLGRFLSQDPLALMSGEANSYTFAGNNPVNLVDPSGLYSLPNLNDLLDGARSILDQNYNDIVRGAAQSAFLSAASGAYQAWKIGLPSDAIFGAAGAGGAEGVGIAGELAIGSIAETVTTFPQYLLVAGVAWTFHNGLQAAGNQWYPGGYSGALDDVLDYGDVVGPLANDYVNFELDVEQFETAIKANLESTLGQVVSEIVGSGDPNQLIGPAGYGARNYIMDSGLYSYEIIFQNETNATAPAQIVQISDPLSSNLNWSSFSLTEIAFGDDYISVPMNSQHFQTNLPFSYNGVNFQLEIEAGINLANGQVYANFYSIDPATDLPPNVEIGFLPPENGTGRGTGFISYFVRPKTNLLEGTIITNVASIQFDANPVIMTDQLSDTNAALGIDTNKIALIAIDDVPPVSSVDSLPPIETTTSFAVCWSGTDVGSGIVSYDIYVSTNMEPWTAWLLGTSNTCGTFSGRLATTYGFYSVAHDGAGNIQLAPTAAQTTTSVTANAPVIITAPMWNGDGQFQFSFDSLTGVFYTVEYSTDLIHWISILDFEGSGGIRTVMDPNAGESTERFYRVRMDDP